LQSSCRAKHLVGWPCIFSSVRRRRSQGDSASLSCKFELGWSNLKRILCGVAPCVALSDIGSTRAVQRRQTVAPESRLQGSPPPTSTLRLHSNRLSHPTTNANHGRPRDASGAKRFSILPGSAKGTAKQDPALLSAAFANLTLEAGETLRCSRKTISLSCVIQALSRTDLGFQRPLMKGGSTN
jgi:hypothetical protein